MALAAAKTWRCLGAGADAAYPMGLDYRNLDADTRKYMLEELEISRAEGLIYYSNYLSEGGKAEWLDLLGTACAGGNDVTLAQALGQAGRLLTRTLRKKPKGGFTEVAVPHTANETLAEGQFNRLYIRAICRRALAAGQKTVLVYRAADRMHERPNLLRWKARNRTLRNCWPSFARLWTSIPASQSPIPGCALSCWCWCLSRSTKA